MVDLLGENKKKMSHKTLELSKNAGSRDVSSVRTVFRGSGSSSSYRYNLQSQAGSVDYRRNTVIKGIGQSYLENSISGLSAGCRCHAPLPSLAQHQQELVPSRASNLKQDHAAIMENEEDRNETESLEEGEFIPDKSPDAPANSSMNEHDVVCHGDEKNCVSQGQSPFDGSKNGILMKNMTRNCSPKKCLLTRRDFLPGNGSRARVKDLAQEFTSDKSCNPSIKSSATAHAFKWCGNKNRADNHGVGAKEAGLHSRVKFRTSSLSMTDSEHLRKENILRSHGDIVNKSNRCTRMIIKEVRRSVRCSPGASPIMKDKGSKRKSLDRCHLRKFLEESSEDLQVIPKLDIGRARPSFSELRKTSVLLGDGHDSSRERVIAITRLYRDICHKLSREKSKAGKASARIRRIDLHAAKEVKKRAGYVHGTMKFIGDVPGVKVGDKFCYRMELAVVGLHHPPRSGIDYMRTHPNFLATSVVASWDYTDNLSKPDELVYLGQGGMPGRDKEAEDQKLTRGNLALVNSMETNRPVRVIRKNRDQTFTYDGLYMVSRCWKLRRASGHMVFKFLMKRLPGQVKVGLKKKMKVLEPSRDRKCRRPALGVVHGRSS